MSVNDIFKLFFGEDSLPARHRQRGQDRYFIDRGASDYSDPYDKPGMVWRGMDYDAFVTKLKEAAVARADDTIQDEIGRAEAPLQATEGALAEGGGEVGDVERQAGESMGDFLRRRFPDTFQDSGAISPTAAATQNNSRRSFNPIQQEQPGDTGLREQAGVPTQPQPSRTTIV